MFKEEGSSVREALKCKLMRRSSLTLSSGNF